MPDASSRIAANVGDGWGFADADAFVLAALAIKIEALVEDHPRVSRMWWQDRVYNFALFGN